MTSENNPKVTDGAIHGANQRAHEPGSEQALFMDKLREAARSTTEKIGRPDASERKGIKQVSESSSAVKDILNGFSLDGTDKA